MDHYALERRRVGPRQTIAVDGLPLPKPIHAPSPFGAREGHISTRSNLNSSQSYRGPQDQRSLFAVAVACAAPAALLALVIFVLHRRTSFVFLGVVAAANMGLASDSVAFKRLYAHF